jgi:hypothetical protein
MPFKAKYVALANPVWPMSPQRASRIYKTIGRAIQAPNALQKHALLQALVLTAQDLELNYATVTATQAAFNAWINQQVNRLQAMPFTWTQAGGTPHSKLSLGAAQKFVNLVVKDWWALSPYATPARTAFLHGPLDQLVYRATSHYRGTLPSLINSKGMYRSYVYYLTPNDYATYQNQLLDLGGALSSLVGVPAGLSRIETEQLIWGWV